MEDHGTGEKVVIELSDGTTKDFDIYDLANSKSNVCIIILTDFNILKLFGYDYHEEHEEAPLIKNITFLSDDISKSFDKLKINANQPKTIDIQGEKIDPSIHLDIPYGPDNFILGDCWVQSVSVKGVDQIRIANSVIEQPITLPHSLYNLQMESSLLEINDLSPFFDKKNMDVLVKVLMKGSKGFDVFVYTKYRYEEEIGWEGDQPPRFSLELTKKYLTSLSYNKDNVYEPRRVMKDKILSIMPFDITTVLYPVEEVNVCMNAEMSEYQEFFGAVKDIFEENGYDFPYMMLTFKMGPIIHLLDEFDKQETNVDTLIIPKEAKNVQASFFDINKVVGHNELRFIEVRNCGLQDIEIKEGMGEVGCALNDLKTIEVPDNVGALQCDNTVNIKDVDRVIENGTEITMVDSEQEV